MSADGKGGVSDDRFRIREMKPPTPPKRGAKIHLPKRNSFNVLRFFSPLGGLSAKTARWAVLAKSQFVEVPAKRQRGFSSGRKLRLISYRQSKIDWHHIPDRNSLSSLHTWFESRKHAYNPYSLSIKKRMDAL